MKDQEADRTAVAIYVVMAHDVSDAIDMINECETVRTLDTLLKMLRGEGVNTDYALNALFVGLVERRLKVLMSLPSLGASNA